jgi:hypothetical protein
MNNLTISSLKNRLELAELCNDLGLLNTAAEIGVWRGDFSDPFLQHWQGNLMYLVDPWKKLDSNEYDDIRNRDYNPEDYKHVIQRFKQYGNRASIMRCFSREATKLIKGNLDFVYIDANHGYKYIKEDIDIWYNKIREGGILAGHDVFVLSHPQVTSALYEFSLEKKLMVSIIPGDYNDKGELINAHSWYVVKP